MYLFSGKFWKSQGIFFNWFGRHCVNSCFANIQCGGRKGRSTIDHLVRLESNIRKAFTYKEHYVSIIFDMEKAYDMTWVGGIVRDLNDMGMCGLLPKYLATFLQRRRFSVKVKNAKSDVKIQENGIPQGSIYLSPFLPSRSIVY